MDPFYPNILSMPQVFEQSLFLFFFRPINDHTKTAAASRRNDILLLSPDSWNGERTKLSECTLDWRQNEVRAQMLLMAVDNCMRRLGGPSQQYCMKRAEKQRDTRTEIVFKVPRGWIKYRCIVVHLFRPDCIYLESITSLREE